LARVALSAQTEKKVPVFQTCVFVAPIVFLPQLHPMVVVLALVTTATQLELHTVHFQQLTPALAQVVVTVHNILPMVPFWQQCRGLLARDTLVVFKY
jgi:hypothetical protein